MFRLLRLGAIAFVSVSLLALAAPPSPAVPADISTVPTVPTVPTVSHAPDGTSKKSCEWVNAVAAWYPNWASSQFCASFWGSSDSTTMAYAWKIAPGTNTRICVKGLGYPKQANGSRKATWYNLGCGTSGGGTKIPWGPIIAYPKVKAQTQPGFLGGAYSWTD
jgi:hypothetical protein